MEAEETTFLYNVQYLPQTVMSDAEYKARRDGAVESMLGQRLATKGVLALEQIVDERMLSELGIPAHQRQAHLTRWFEREANHKFATQIDSNCMDCPHRATEVALLNDHKMYELRIRAKTLCGAKLNGGATCFDGYMPGSNMWKWPEHSAIIAEFAVGKPNKQGLTFATLCFVHADRSTTFYDPRELSVHKEFGDIRDEPPGPMTRNNADSGYLTRDEIELADIELAKLSKVVRATMPSPQTPCDDAW